MTPEFNDEEDILEQLANGLDLSQEDRDRYKDLQRIPFGQRTPEVHDSVERLVFLGSGIPEADVEEYQRIKCIPVADRTPEELEFIYEAILASSLALHPREVDVVSPLFRQRICKLFNHFAVFPQPFNDPAYLQLIERLNADLDQARESEE